MKVNIFVRVVQLDVKRIAERQFIRGARVLTYLKFRTF